MSHRGGEPLQGERFRVPQGEGPVRGPFTRAQIDADIESGQLCPTDLIRQDEGPWQTVGEFRSADAAEPPRRTGPLRADLWAGGLLAAVLIAGAAVLSQSLAMRRELLARLGSAQAQYRLGAMYDTGEGMPRDLVMASAWYNLAAARGMPEARQARDRLEALLMREQVTEAQRLSRTLIPGS